jgi:CBS domain-containing protein
MIESANTSLQLHLQVGPEEFAALYNLAQLITAPLLAAATNSPLLLGRRLWHETRVALFERSIDERSPAQHERRLPSRVGFGEGWVRDSVLELLRDNTARFHVLMAGEIAEDPLDTIREGGIPSLAALCMHNSTVWRWNRPCYGVSDGRAHLRIENRVLASGPTVLDEVANAALFYGLMLRLAADLGDVGEHFAFEEARANFVAAARHGLDASFDWPGRRAVAARELLLDTLIPAARKGLAGVDVPAADIDRYLGTLHERIETGRTGSTWVLDTLAAASSEGPREHAFGAVTRAMLQYQASGLPGHRWGVVAAPAEDSPPAPACVRDLMTTDLFTVLPSDVLDLASAVMDWRHVRHVPVEDEAGRLVGLLGRKALLRLLHAGALKGDAIVPVSSVMRRDYCTIGPGTPLALATRLLLGRDDGCLLVTERGRLVGIVTDRDLLGVWTPPSAADG